MLSYCSDITNADNPFTIGMERLLDIDKPQNYIGKEALQRIAKSGPERRLVGANFSGAPVTPNEEFLNVYHRGSVVGHITRCVFSPRLKHNIALVNLPTELTAPGTNIKLDTHDGWQDAEVVKLPWFPSQKVIPSLQKVTR